MNNQEKKIRIGGAAGFWGDSEEGPKQLVEKGQLDYLVFDYLAEITMSILARMRSRSDEAGYATDFINPVMKTLLPKIAEKGIRVISNAGGVNPIACKKALEEIAAELGIPLKVAVVLGDDLMPRAEELSRQGITEMESGEPLPDRLMSSNCYLGALPIVKALELGAQVVITGRCADSACTLAPLIHEFGWSPEQYNLLAQGSLAGHLIECGAQASGGIFTDWETIGPFDDMGFPIVECSADGLFEVTKPPQTGGLVSPATIAEQMVYEIGDPRQYILPDVVCDFSQVCIDQSGENRVLVSGAKGAPPTPTYKVSSTWQDGYRATSMVTFAGGNAAGKARATGEAILKRASRLISQRGWGDFTETCIEVIGAESMYGKHARDFVAREVVLKTAVRHPKKEAIGLFAREIAPAATSMTPGMTGFFAGRPNVVPVIRLFSFLIDKQAVPVHVILEGDRLEIEIPAGDPLAKLPEPETASIGYEEEAVEQIEIPLSALAFARSGDKGDHANIGVIARKAEFYPLLDRLLTEQNVADRFSHFLKGEVKRFPLPGICGFNFMLYNALGGGGVASLRIDPQGKSYGQILLDMPLSLPSDWVAIHLPEQQTGR